MFVQATQAAQASPAVSGAMGRLNDAFRLDLLAKLALAVLLGGAIGLERELQAKPAGLRTNILICIGAALLTHVSMNIGIIGGAPRVGDPGRIAAQIVSGIGFIGAGTIMQAGGTVTGLTSAATIWVVAAVGMTVGAGYYIEAAGATILVTVVLNWLGRLEYRVRRLYRVGHFTIRTRPGLSPDELFVALSAEGIKVKRYEMYDHRDDRTFELRLVGPAVQLESLPERLQTRADILSARGG